MEKTDIDRLHLAIHVALYAHSGQRDKAGSPYILHPLRVMLAMDSEEAMIAAVLHDVVEDSAVTVADIRDTFGGTVADAVDALTRREGEDYTDFITRCGTNPLARRVKQADLHDNRDLSRLGREVTAADLSRDLKYSRAQSQLRETNHD